MDAGNALFKPGAADDRPSRQRASLILDAMGALGTAAMAVGHQDLLAGPEFLKKAAQKAKLPLLSANLVDAAGKPLFPASRVVSTAGMRVALVGASAPEQAAAFSAKLPVQAALAQARKLRPQADVVVVLAAMPYADALQLAKEAAGAVDLILQSHEARGAGGAQRYDESFVVPTGERGRQLGRVDLELCGRGPWIDAGEKDRGRQLINLLDVQIAEARKRVDSASPSTKSAAEKTLHSFEARRDSLAKESAQPLPPGARFFKLDFLTLGTEYADDPTLKAKVAVLEPEGAAP